jgi:hypothetical protein
MKTFDHYELKYTVSNESLMGFVKDLYAGKKPKVDSNGTSKFIAELEKTYANPEWVKKRGVVSGQVNVKKGSVLESDLTSQLNKIRECSRHNSNNIKQWVNANFDIVELINRLKKADLTEEDFKKVANTKYIKIKEDWKTVGDTKVSNKKINALSEKEVVEIAKKLIQVNELLFKTVYHITEYIAKYQHVDYDELAYIPRVAMIVDGEDSDPRIAMIQVEKFLDDCYDLYTDNTGEIDTDLALRVYAIMDAMISWLDESVK